MTARGALANDTKSGREAIGRSRGGLTTKIHLAAHLRCRPIARLTSCGQHGDSPRFVPLMDAIRIPRRGLGRPRQRPGRAMADKAYSSRANRAWLRRHGIAAVIPVKEDQKRHRRDRGRAGGLLPAFHASWYKKRNTVERCFAKLKQFRAVATRYDKRERIYQGTIDVASISIWLRDPVPMIHGTRPNAGSARAAAQRRSQQAAWPGRRPRRAADRHEAAPEAPERECRQLEVERLHEPDHGAGPGPLAQLLQPLHLRGSILAGQRGKVHPPPVPPRLYPEKDSRQDAQHPDA